MALVSALLPSIFESPLLDHHEVALPPYPFIDLNEEGFQYFYANDFKDDKQVGNEAKENVGITPMMISKNIQEDFNVQSLDINETNTSEKILDFINQKIDSGTVESSFFVTNLGALITQYHKWFRLLPRVVPFYAVKCNPDKAIIRVLASLGAGFDCASREEIQLVKSFDCPPHKIIYANPCKPASHIRFACKEGVRMVTFDNEDELIKISKYMPDAELVLRILPESRSLMNFGSKYGASWEACPPLLQLASDLKLNVIGVSFHVGSGCYDTISYTNALLLSRQVFDLAEDYGFRFTLLDIGGGFPGTDNQENLGLTQQQSISIEEVASVVNPLLDQLFPPHIRVISEPGRYFAASTLTIVAAIHSRRRVLVQRQQQRPGVEDGKKFLYYIDEGVYGTFNCIFFDHQHPLPVPLFKSSDRLEIENGPGGCEKKYLSNVFGPTCDSLDLVAKEVLLPELFVGDWLYFENMGAYTTAAASSFNGFKTSSQFYVAPAQFLT